MSMTEVQLLALWGRLNGQAKEMGLQIIEAPQHFTVFEDFNEVGGFTELSSLEVFLDGYKAGHKHGVYLGRMYARKELAAEQARASRDQEAEETCARVVLELEAEAKEIAGD